MVELLEIMLPVQLMQKLESGKNWENESGSNHYGDKANEISVISEFTPEYQIMLHIVLTAMKYVWIL